MNKENNIFLTDFIRFQKNRLCSGKTSPKYGPWYQLVSSDFFGNASRKRVSGGMGGMLVHLRLVRAGEHTAGVASNGEDLFKYTFGYKNV